MSIVEIVASVAILAGSTVVAIAGIGLVRLPDPLMRMHATTKAGVVGSGLVMIGIALSLGTFGAIMTGLLGLFFLLATSPLASHALGRAAYASGAPVSPSTAVDALAGVLPRPDREIGALPPRATPGTQGEFTPTANGGVHVMNAVEEQTARAMGAQPAAPSLRLVTAWLIGGESQPNSTRLAVDIAAASRAALVGLSAQDFASADPPGPYSIGGLSWAKWLGGQRRARMRERAARAISEFEQLTQTEGVSASIRHEELNLFDLMPIVAGTDLVVVPAGVDPTGEPAIHSDELAAQLSAMRCAPVLRVRSRPDTVSRIALIVSNSLDCSRLAQTLVRSGLWNDAAAEFIPIGGHRPDVKRMIDEQKNLLLAHGYRTSVAAEIELNAESDAIKVRLAPFDAVVLGVMTNRRGWLGSVREDVHELASEYVPLVLLP